MIRANATLLAILSTVTIAATNAPTIASPNILGPKIIDLAQADSQITAQSIPRQTIRKIQLDIQKRYKVSLNQIKLVGAQDRTWNGCMGLEKPNTACIEIAISGWQVIMAGPNNRFWVYHVDQSGDRLGLNINASLPLRSQIPAPRFIDRVVPASDDTTIFQSAMTTGEAMAYYAIELKSDGDRFVLTRRKIAPTMGKPEVIKRLGKSEVEPFLNLLTNNSFAHFNQISYFNSEKVAVDAPVGQLSSYGMATEYTAGDEDKLPPKLQAIVRAWGKLIK
jgi:hypothetical protein